ncbi:MAG TPA: GH1 family beta-glucosidase [Terriglobales bacterium]|nr:GH1 family beta-glucosidase [Terriglobales bacterium]
MPDRTPTRWTRRAFLATVFAAAVPPVFVPRWRLPGPGAPPFPPAFLWGAASSAYQTEGAADEPGKGRSVWDEFVQRPGAIADGQSGSRACDFFHRYPEDIALLRALGCNAFRFSLAWTRILPDGAGAVRQSGLDFYRRLVDALLAAGIEPVATLFHWDTPATLQRRGGWQSRDMAHWFADYATVAARALADRVRCWLTINEPRSFIGGGYVTGVQAPGLRLGRRQSLAAAHHVLLAHGRAVQALRAHAPRPLRIGIPNDISPALPVAPADANAAYTATFQSPLGHFTPARWWDENAWWHEPIYAGEYPAAALAALGPDAPAIAAGDMATIRQPLDFIAANVYGGRRVTANAQGEAVPQPWPPGFPQTAFGWPVTPEVLYWAPRWLHQRYRLPVFITENGCSTRDWVSLDGQVHDPQRLDFLQRHLRFLAQAAAEGTPLLGYLHWSLLDNFEWQAGYTQRFGLVFVNFPNGHRIVKDSARGYARLIASRGAALAAATA